VQVVVTSGRRWGKITIEVADETFERVRRIARRYGFRLEDAVKILLRGDFIDDETYVSDEELEALHREVESLEEELYELEGKWSPLKFKTYYLAMDNQNLAIQVSAMIAQNRRMRRILGMDEKDFSRAEELIHYYMSSAFGSDEKTAGD